MVIWNVTVLAQEGSIKAARAAGHEEPASTGAQGSPFAVIAAIMRWETFHMVQVLWMSVIDLPVTAAEKDWGLQVCSLLPPRQLPC